MDFCDDIVSLFCSPSLKDHSQELKSNVGHFFLTLLLCIYTEDKGSSTQNLNLKIMMWIFWCMNTDHYLILKYKIFIRLVINLSFGSINFTCK